jgi:hypothetical protein
MSSGVYDHEAYEAKFFFLLFEYITPTWFLYIYILLTCCRIRRLPKPSTLNPQPCRPTSLARALCVGSVDVMQTRARERERQRERESACARARESERERGRETHKADGTVVVVQLVDACVLLRASNL